MKELILFLKWQWNKWEFWQKCFVVSSAFFGAGLSAQPPYSTYLFMVPSAVVFVFMTKWMVWDGAKNAWQSYKKEKAELFQVIKGDK